MVLRFIILASFSVLLLSLWSGLGVGEPQMTGIIRLSAAAPEAIPSSGPPGDRLARIPAKPIPPTLFGMHIHYAHTSRPWPPIPFFGWRLWDAGVSWRYLEPARRNWQFEMLDRYVELARARNVEIVLTLGKTPAWASARPREATPDNEPGAAAEPARLEDWKTYVKTVATRYKGQIQYYEIWNEPNLKEFFSGTVDQMVTLAREAYKILKEVDPAVSVISPSATGPLGYLWLDLYFSRGGAPFADIVGYHFYVIPEPPEAMLPVINEVRVLMTKYGIGGKPLWNTESGWANPKVFPNPDEAAGYVARSYILNWAASVDRLYWYAWDNYNWVTLRMTERNDYRTLNPAALAYGEIQKWLVGTTMSSCDQTNEGTWVVRLQRKDGSRGWIVWHPAGKALFQIPNEWKVTQIRDLKGTTRLLTGDGAATVGMAPVLMEQAPAS